MFHNITWYTNLPVFLLNSEINTDILGRLCTCIIHVYGAFCKILKLLKKYAKYWKMGKFILKSKRTAWRHCISSSMYIQFQSCSVYRRDLGSKSALLLSMFGFGWWTSMPLAWMSIPLLGCYQVLKVFSNPNKWLNAYMGVWLRKGVSDAFAIIFMYHRINCGDNSTWHGGSISPWLYCMAGNFRGAKLREVLQ